MTKFSDPSEPLWLGTITPGTIDRRILMQDTYWVNMDAEVFRLEDMSLAYRTAVLDMLTRRARVFHLHAMADTIFDSADALETGTMTGEELGYGLTGTSSANATPDEWLNTTPLVRKLRQFLKY